MMPAFNVEPQKSQSVDPSSYATSVFVDPDERLLAKLGNGWVVNFLVSGSKKSLNGLLSDKRLYLQGMLLNGGVSDFGAEKTEKILDLEDITGSGFTYREKTALLIIGVLIINTSLFLSLFRMIGGGSLISIYESLFIGLPGIVLGLVFLYLYYLSKISVFFIEYAGGGIRIGVNIVSLNDLHDFNKQIRRAKDRVKEQHRK